AIGQGKRRATADSRRTRQRSREHPHHRERQRPPWRRRTPPHRSRDRPRRPEDAAQRTEVDHYAVAGQKSVLGPTLDLRLTDNWALSIDAERLAERATKGAKVTHHATAVKESVDDTFAGNIGSANDLTEAIYPEAML